MFIVCSNCEFKYLVNSADLKPNGRMVECANCNHQWYQEIDITESLSTAPSTKKEKLKTIKTSDNKEEDYSQIVKNLPSTVVRNEKPSIMNSILLVFVITFIFIAIWILKSYNLSTFVLIDFYIREFFFNLNLIISDFAKIIYNILN